MRLFLVFFLFSDLSGRCEFAEEKLRKTGEELEKAKDSREQMYERYVLSREEVKTQYEERLQVKGLSNEKHDYLKRDRNFTRGVNDFLLA